MSSLFKVLLPMMAYLALAKADCMMPLPAKGFTNSAYNGLWYEIGKFQTAGGAAFEKDCVCTTIDIFPVAGATNGDSTAVNSCRKLTPSGDFLNATGSLTGEVVPGKWKEGFFFFAPKVDYTIAYLDEHLAIEYDCSSFLWLTNYCVHLLARTPTISAADEQKLIDFSNSLGLNNQNLDYQTTLQANCW